MPDSATSPTPEPADPAADEKASAAASPGAPATAGTGAGEAAGDAKSDMRAIGPLAEQERALEQKLSRPALRRAVWAVGAAAALAFLAYALANPGKAVLVDVLIPVVNVRFALPSYFTMLVLGFMVAIYMTWKLAPEVWPDRDDAPDRMLDFNLLMLVTGVLGARAMHVIADGFFWDYVHLCTNPALVDLKVDVALAPAVKAARCANLGGVLDAGGVCRPSESDCLATLKIWNGGLAWYGGLLACIPVAWWYQRRYRLGWLKLADLSSPFIALGLFFGRMGCWMSGCCFGQPTDVAWAVRFPPNSAASWEQNEDGLLPSRLLESLPVHPTQLYEAFASLALAAYLYFWVRKHKRFDGQEFFSLLALYGLIRFFVEMVRADDRGTVLGLLSSSQAISLPLVALGIFFLYRNGKRAEAAARGGGGGAAAAVGP
ncbi:MAG TPA: prolipoprotein diacylglyceryl transferase [Myxococcota bacterium]|jgi:phosphatidylglycerol:prolipoprotein diacylglycerol transferase|nr:prolipoprotein diacylglyceryl transferase [Myxococcota bacterium]